MKQFDIFPSCHTKRSRHSSICSNSRVQQQPHCFINLLRQLPTRSCFSRHGLEEQRIFSRDHQKTTIN